MKLRFALLLLALLPLSAFAADPVAGVDYVEIADGKPYAPLNGKVEVVEVFGYTCIHCAHFQPVVSAWHKKQPSWVRFTPVPAAFGGFWTPYARAYYAAAKLRVLAKTHDAMFKALHEQGSLPIQNASSNEIATWYASYGVDPQAFVAAMENPATDLLLERSKEFALATGVEFTPTLIVNGKYRVTGGSFEDTLRIADYLIARERARK
ncbi:thiol:disulfide interchange protein DsbA/DsbL [Pseudoxanthomonas sp. CF125]|uniref:thiol:disulfide interchange protein DsbA/DsbL n=1 Tax=Pseudoxanthomonas sp. CF125 TaxID=1855303 RepID=UPI00088CC63E|nr:thiol:disulfide interchange protein DsbA/DsbL [Pseudoxanthomonas sp. CF125]SDR17642.1 thiol:disulfide interchange protein DsbA [Pseudoxanthomonas sp. CF125]